MPLEPNPEFDLVDFHLYWFGVVRLATLVRRLRRRDEETAGRLMDRYALERAPLRGPSTRPFFDPDLRARGWYTAPRDFVPRNAWFADPQTHDPDRLLAYLAAERGMLTPLPPGWKREPAEQRRGIGERTPDFDELLPLDAPPELGRQAIEAPVLRTLLRSLLPDPFHPMSPRVQQACSISYLGADRRTARTISIVPIALTHDSFRWAVHALGPDGPRDYVLHRLVGCEIVGKAPEVSAHPSWIEDGATVKLKPRDGLPHPERIVNQYGMTGGVLEVPMRPAFVVYFLKRHQLETDLIDLPGAPPDSTFDIPGREPHQQPLAIANPEEVRAWIPDGMRIPPRDV